MDKMAFAVYDSKVKMYLAPFFFISVGQAMRAWETTVNNPETEFYKYPGDFTLFQIGSYNEELGEFKTLEHKVNLGTALQSIKKHEPLSVSQSN